MAKKRVITRRVLTAVVAAPPEPQTDAEIEFWLKTCERLNEIASGQEPDFVDRPTEPAPPPNWAEPTEWDRRYPPGR